MLLRAVFLSVVLAPSLAAQEWAITPQVSTLGLGAEVSYRLRSPVGFRAGYTLLDFNRTDDIEGIVYQVSPALRHAKLGVDFYPLGSGFRLSGGLVYNRSRVDGVGVLDQPVTVGGQTYQPEEVGELIGLARYDDDWMPWIGLGIAGGGRISVTFDVGVIFAGHPAVQLRTRGGTLSESEQAILDQNVAAEQAELQQAINDEKLAKYYPIVSLGLKIRL
jgi:hypothetical protein